MAKVSILLPVFNAGSYLSSAVASLLLQDHHDLEIIAIDDGSSDGSDEILRRAARMDKRVRVISRPNRGLIATLNEGLELATSDFVARMDADDIAYPQRISSQLQAFAADPELALHGCHFDTIQDDRMLPPAAPNLTEPSELRILARFCTILRHPGIMLRRSLLPEGVLHYDSAYPCAEDFDLFRRIAACCRVRQGTTPQLAYRLHEGSVSATRIATMTHTHLRILEEEMLRYYPQASTPGLSDLAYSLDEVTVARAASLIRRLRDLSMAQSPEQERAFQLGIEVTFYFIFSTICRSHDYRLACDFVAEAGCWDMIRRREQPLLRVARRGPALARLGYAVHERQQKWMWRLRSRAYSSTTPAYRQIADLAHRIAGDAEQIAYEHA